MKFTAFTILVLLSISAALPIVELESKLLLDNKIELKVPKDFEIMPEKMLRTKYPLDRRPTLVFTNKTGTINVALNHTQSQANQELIPSYLDHLVQTFKQAYPTATWKDSSIKVVNGQQVGCMELITPAFDTDIYNLMFFTDLDGRLLLCTFNCTKNYMEEWSPTAKEIMGSLEKQ